MSENTTELNVDINRLKLLLIQQEAIIDHIPHIVWFKDVQSHYIMVNEVYAQFFGSRKEDFVGKNDFDLWPYELASKYQEDDRYVLNNGLRFNYEQMITKNDNIIWMETTKTPIFNSEDLIIGTVGIAQNITERKKTAAQQQQLSKELIQLNGMLQKELDERQKLEAQLLHSQRMESIGQLAAGVAHEINNPIGFIMSNLNTLSEYIDVFKKLLEQYDNLETLLTPNLINFELEVLLTLIKQERQNENLCFILQDVNNLMTESQEGIRRVKEIVTGLKIFAHEDDQQLIEADINQCIESTIKMIWNELKYKCEVQTNLAPLPYITCYPGQLNQVFMNLLVNAAQAIPEKGEIKVTTLLEEAHVVIQIQDNGIGISPKIRHAIFNPFFTTKPVGEGTGLGLSISYGIIQKHHGTIDVQSNVGKGTLFTIRLPLKQCGRGGSHHVS